VRSIITSALCPIAVLALSACRLSQPADEEPLPAPDESAATPGTAADRPGGFPAGLVPLGEGYPAAGDPCRQLGEGEITSNWLGDKTLLAGCPTRESADALGGTIVETVEGIYLVTLPIDRKPADRAQELLAGDGFQATGTVRCAIRDPEFIEECTAGVKREWGPERTTLVEITKSDGKRRALFFDGARAYGADGVVEDGSIGWKFEARRRGGNSIITFGPERYAIPDALVIGQ
jgi:hypothetical protein